MIQAVAMTIIVLSIVSLLGTFCLLYSGTWKLYNRANSYYLLIFITLVYEIVGKLILDAHSECILSISN